MCMWWFLSDEWEWGEYIKSAYIHLKWLENLLGISHSRFSLHWLACAWVMHESVLGLNLCAPKLCVEICSSCVTIIMLHIFSVPYIILALCLSCQFPLCFTCSSLCILANLSICSLNLSSDCCCLFVSCFWGSPLQIRGWLSLVTWFCLWCIPSSSLWSWSIVQASMITCLHVVPLQLIEKYLHDYLHHHLMGLPVFSAACYSYHYHTLCVVCWI